MYRIGVLVLFVASAASAEPSYGTRRVIVDMAPAPRPPGAQISPFLYLNRCRGGCTIHGGTNDAKSNSSAIPAPGTYMLGEFGGAFGQTGAMGLCLGNGTTPCTTDVQCG